MPKRTRASERRIPQTQRDEEAYKKQIDKARKQLLVKDLNETFASGHGQRSLRWLMNLCGYQKASVVADPASGEVQINSTVYNEARRNIYLTLRAHLKNETLIPVENRQLSIDEDVDVFS